MSAHLFSRSYCGGCARNLSPDHFYDNKNCWQCKECARARARAHYQKNREKKLKAASDRQTRLKEDPDFRAKRAHLKRRRDARLADAETDNIQYQLTGQLCYICEKEVADTIDHIHPISKGGSDTIDNKSGACGPCNYSKSARVYPGHPDWEEFLAERRD